VPHSDDRNCPRLMFLGFGTLAWREILSGQTRHAAVVTAHRTRLDWAIVLSWNRIGNASRGIANSPPPLKRLPVFSLVRFAR
jgi:hypothetical protein